jgi:hypothetical protein
MVKQKKPCAVCRPEWLSCVALIVLPPRRIEQGHFESQQSRLDIQIQPWSVGLLAATSGRSFGFEASMQSNFGPCGGFVSP